MKSNKKYVVDANFIKEAHNLNLSLTEFLLLLYFENSDDFILDFADIEKKLKIDRQIVLEAFNNLLSKNIISLQSEKNKEGKIYDKVSLDNFYNQIKETKKTEEKGKLKNNIFSTFESEFRRPLNGMEFEIIKAWLEVKLYPEELILTALNEAIYNGVPNMRYIDTILHEWNKKGFKCKDDVEKNLKNNYNFKKEDPNLFEYNWLEDYEK